MAVGGISRPLLRIWFIVASTLMTWDFMYMFLRPRSMPGGDLHALWKPYALYGTIDKVYSREAYEKQLGWPLAQSAGNVFEVAIMCYHLSLKATTGRSDLIAMFVSTLTFYKTLLYWAIDFFSGWQESGHNGAFNWWILYICVNNIWTVVPAIYTFIIGKDLYAGLGGDEAPSSPSKSTRAKKAK